MKKTIFSLFFSLICSFIFMSCGHDKFETINYEKVQVENFVNDFNKTFNVTSADYANHQWGMNIVPLVDITNTSLARTTRAADPNGNQWADKGYTVPGPITADELRNVLKVFNEVGNATYESLIDWDCYFVQQVYKGVATHPSHATGNAPVVGSEHMDWLCTFTTKKTEIVSYWPYEERVVTVDEYADHINNFNNGNCGAWDGIMLMRNTDSYSFGFKSSEDNGHVFRNFRMEKINGNYYVGFDFQADGSNPNEQIDRDYIYNDWIVKIVPGNGTPVTEVDRVRIMAEDLGTATSDFDYNDIVFDIKFIKNGNVYVADIVLQAAGGTLPLTIGGYEVHNLFAEANNDHTITTETMINTGAGHHNDYSPVHFTVTLEGNYANAWDAINSLPIIVLYNNTPIQLTVNPGTPAEMIAVPTTTDWSDERVSIRNRYPAFVTWISDSSIQWWE